MQSSQTAAAVGCWSRAYKTRVGRMVPQMNNKKTAGPAPCGYFSLPESLSKRFVKSLLLFYFSRCEKCVYTQKYTHSEMAGLDSMLPFEDLKSSRLTFDVN
ncbi:hypothetical protein [Chromobacterium alticapitis]|uniref:hypothetical protein n=1 Tax=Chromobacterium alticapitis TaxID=2073169 RepID=UPI0011B0C250|nr:hypothetical protein [Chromobacterium alticapitis]